MAGRSHPSSVDGDAGPVIMGALNRLYYQSEAHGLVVVSGDTDIMRNMVGWADYHKKYEWHPSDGGTFTMIWPAAAMRTSVFDFKKPSDPLTTTDL